MENNRVQRRSILIIVLATLLPLAVVSGLVIALSNQATRDAAKQEQLAISKLAARAYSQSITTSTNQLQVFGNTIISSSDLFEITNERLYPLLISNPLWNEVGFYTIDGNLQASAFRAAPSHLPISLSSSDRERVSKQKVIYIDPEPLHNDVPRFRILAFLDGNSSYQGILVGEIVMDQLWQITQTLEQSSASRIFVTTSTGRLISASAAQVLQNNPVIDQQNWVDDTHTAEYSSLTNDNVLGARSEISETGWFVIVERPFEQIYAALIKLLMNMLWAVLAAIALALVIGWFAGRQLSQPIKLLHTSVEAFGKDSNNYIPVQLNSRDELAELGSAFNTMALRLRENQEELSQSNEHLEHTVAERTQELQQRVSELDEYSKVQQELIETIRHLSIPVVPITRDIVIMNLVGNITDERASDIISHLLAAIEGYRAKVALIDVTGITLIDTRVAHTIIEAVEASRLLGTEVIIVGIRPEIAQTLVSLNVNLHFSTAAQLEQGFLLAQQKLSKKKLSVVRY